LFILELYNKNMNITTITSDKWTQEGLDVIIEGNEVTITSGKLVLANGTAELKKKETFLLNDETDTIGLVEDLTTGETLVALIDKNAKVDNENYRLIDRLAWKDSMGQWNKLKIIGVPTQPVGKYNYEGLNTEGIKKGLTIRPGGQVKQN